MSTDGNTYDDIFSEWTREVELPAYEPSDFERALQAEGDAMTDEEAKALTEGEFKVSAGGRWFPSSINLYFSALPVEGPLDRCSEAFLHMAIDSGHWGLGVDQTDGSTVDVEGHEIERVLFSALEDVDNIHLVEVLVELGMKLRPLVVARRRRSRRS